MQPFSYHTHTVFSDGRNTAEEMIARAVELGWEEIGISDHLIVHRNIRRENQYYDDRHFKFHDFQPALPVIKKNIESIRRVAAKFPAIKVRIGFEIDYFDYPGWEEEFREFLKQIDLDYLHSGNHYYLDENERIIGITAGKVPDKMIREHFQRIVKATESGLFDFIAHLDYARWGGSIGEFDFQPERREVIAALARTNTAFELSTKGLRAIGDFYPARWMLEELRAKNVPVVVSDDAHHASQLGREFAQAESLLKELDYTNRFRL